jgi:hypothetical protein
MPDTVHECDGCGAVKMTDTVAPPPGWVRRGGRRMEPGAVGRWTIVLCDECDARSEAA